MKKEKPLQPDASTEDGPRRKKPLRDLMILTELDQIKVLADPLRIRLLEEFGEERTTKQVAKRLGERPTKLYHHVEALKNQGLIELTRTRQNRGTLEKYYLAAACRFTADSRAFSGAEEPTDDEKQAMGSMITTIFETTQNEMLNLATSGKTAEEITSEGILSFIEVRATPEQIDSLRQKLRDVLDWLLKEDIACGVATGTEEEEGSVTTKSYRLTLACYPLDKDKR